jgi:uncharacterized protein (TIGR03437 family)
MLMLSVLLTGFCTTLLAQSGLPITDYGYAFPPHAYAAPGQLVTLFVYDVEYDAAPRIRQGGRAPGGADLPTTLAGVYAAYTQVQLTPPITRQAPLFDVLPFNTSPAPNPTSAGTEMIAVTIQIPFEALTGGATLFVGTGAPGDQVPGAQMDVVVQADRVHILTGCDAFNATLDFSLSLAAGLPCPSTVTHADGSPVTAKNPAKPGELLVAYGVGLGQTNPPLATGKLVTAAAPTQTTFGLDFNFRSNALATKPLPGAPQPLYAGATPGFVGLYQINFIVPPAPAGTPPCVDASAVPLGSNVVYSNLTVSVGGAFSFDGARICVAVPSP